MIALNNTQCLFHFARDIAQSDVDIMALTKYLGWSGFCEW
jgi:hypothetical protein